ncbi:MAG: PQQ-binding-like beta-propeller repeat protein [Pirellulaceae bacterium]|nr:PQQ-binding-like beta-propeller repeat protein [Pirellulaceae bacterium]
MIRWNLRRIGLLSWVCLAALVTSPARGQSEPVATWRQWRGPSRDGLVTGPKWPKSLNDKHWKVGWRIELGPSYSGPLVTESAVLTTATLDRKTEVVLALDRKTGQELWKAEWPGAMTVPFFAWSNGSWIRSTPCCDDELLFVGGMRDVLVALELKTGKERWRIDFVQQLSAPLPSFGFVSSPLLDGDALYVQAGASLIKLEKATGKVLWRSLEDGGGMMGSAFSSPVLATLAGQRQLVVQTRQKLAGVAPESGTVLWEQVVPNFRGMNILTPVIFGDSVFTSSYENRTWLFAVARDGEKLAPREAWNTQAAGYMSTPVVVAGHAYLHLQNQRFTCVNLATGERTWTSKPFGKYSSLVAQNDLILALDQKGELLLLKANPREFELLDQRKVSDDETWAHLAICGDELFIREQNALATYRWHEPSP